MQIQCSPGSRTRTPTDTSTVHPEPWGKWIYPGEKEAWFYHPLRSLCCTSKQNSLFTGYSSNSALFLSTERRMKADHEPRGSSLIPSMPTIPQTVIAQFPAPPVPSVYLPFGVCCSRSAWLTKDWDTRGPAEAPWNVREVSEHSRGTSVSGGHRGPERKCDSKTDFTRSLGTTETVSNGQKRLRDTNT